MRSLLALAAFVFATPAHAARHEISFDFLGTLTSDNGLAPVARGDIPSFGMRGGGAVLRNSPRTKRFGVVIDGGWNRGQRGQSISVPTLSGNAYANLGASFVLDTITLGAKVDFSIAEMVFPYVHAQIGLLHGQVSLDGDLTSSSNDVYVAEGAAPAGLFALGFDIGPPDTHLGWPATFAFHFEAGYQIAGAMSLGELGGEVDLSGVILRSGVGVRF